VVDPPHFPGPSALQIRRGGSTRKVRRIDRKLLRATERCSSQAGIPRCCTPMSAPLHQSADCVHDVGRGCGSRAAPRGDLGGLEPPRRGGFPPPLSGNLGIVVGGDLSVCTANVRVQSLSVAFTVQIPQRCELTGLLTKHPWMVVYFSSPRQQLQHHTHGCQISTLLYTIILSMKS